MAVKANEYSVVFLLEGGHREEIRFGSLAEFQQWYGTDLAPKADSNDFLNIPLRSVSGEYMVVRPSKICAIRIEPVFKSSVER
jgi:hypothetical protein